jgi:hypothetical protein
MSGDIGFSRRSSSERDIQPVAIISVDPTTRTAIAVTRNRTNLTINCAYATGDTITVPAAGEQWYCERFDGEWRLYNRIPFNDPTLHIKPEEGQVSVGSARGPLELNGTEVRSNAPVLRLNGAYYRDYGGSLQRSTDQVTWQSISPGGLVQLVAKALADYQGNDQTAALASLTTLGGNLQPVVSNFSELWAEACQNVFINGLKQMGFGDTDLEKTINGFQNFINYMSGILFQDFTGDVTPQAFLTGLQGFVDRAV